MAPQAKANYKTYEAQARLVRAIVAAHPEVKWNYKEIVQSFGSDMSEDALNHRFRRLRAEAVIIREGRNEGLDMKDLQLDDLPKTQGAVQKNNIAVYFGQSTADGIQFQFRTIKKDADHLKKVQAAGGDVAKCLPSIGTGGGSTASTPSKTPAKARSSRPLKRGRFVKEEESQTEEEIEDFSEKDIETPSKRQKATTPRATPGQKTGTPSRRAASQAAATIAADAGNSADSSSDFENPNSSRSIFGIVEKKPDRRALDEDIFSSASMGPYVGSVVDDIDESLYEMAGGLIGRGNTGDGEI